VRHHERLLLTAGGVGALPIVLVAWERGRVDRNEPEPDADETGAETGEDSSVRRPDPGVDQQVARPVKHRGGVPVTDEPAGAEDDGRGGDRPLPARRDPTAGRVMGAAMLGVGAIFNPNNVGPDSHWSQAPKVVLEVETRSEGTGLDLDDTDVPEALPERFTPRRRRRWFRRRS
jgi:hypothetical protein